jgi:hypothetical protein
MNQSKTKMSSRRKSMRICNSSSTCNSRKALPIIQSQDMSLRMKILVHKELVVHPKDRNKANTGVGSLVVTNFLDPISLIKIQSWNSNILLDTKLISA